HKAETTNWFRSLIAVVGLVVFSLLYVRIVRAVLDYEYARRDVVAAGAVALIVAVVGGAQATGWGFVPTSWLSAAALATSRRTSFWLGAGTAVVVSPLSVIAVLQGLDRTWLPDTGPATRAGAVVGAGVSVVVYSLV